LRRPILPRELSGRGHGAALLAGDVSRCFLIFEDLGTDLSSFVEPLLKGTADEAERALSLYATALGRLHADAADCLASYDDTFQSIFGGGRQRRPLGRRVENEADFVAVVEMTDGWVCCLALMGPRVVGCSSCSAAGP
jgi:hypothetical protein